MKSFRVPVAILTVLHLLLLRGEVPWWIGLSGALLLATSFVHERFLVERRLGKLRLSPAFQLESLAGVFALAIAVTFRPLVSLESSTSLLYVLLPLQHFQLTQRRAQWRLLFLWIFTLGLIVLGQQGFVVQGLMILDLVVIFYWMSVFELRAGRLSLSGIRSALVFVVLSLPLWLAIFLIFPKFTVELWGSNTSTIGFADNLEPGSVERLIANNEIALRVRFPRAGDFEKTRNRLHYFRGSVMEQGEGLSWRVDKARKWGPAPELDRDAEGILQDIWAREEHGRVLFTLEGPVAIDGGGARVEAARDGIFRLVNTAVRPTHYFALSTGERDGFKAVPGDEKLTTLSEEFRARLKDWMERHPEHGFPVKGDPARVVEKLRAFFQGERFRYSLEPTPLASGGMIEFLEKTKNGFCEHYAAATATLLRYHGIPARIVAGYLGGRKDPYGDDLIVMSRDAHAWVEYLDGGKGTWVRLDPTLWAEPLRWDLGSELNWLTDSAREQLRRLGGDSSASLLPWWLVWEERWRLAWDATVGQGERFVYNYQARWLEDASAGLGVPAAANAVGVGLLAIVGGMLLAILPRFRRFERSDEPWTKLWRKFGKKIGADFRHSYGESEQWAAAKASLAEESGRNAEEFVQAYLRARYRDGKPKPSAELRKLFKSV